MFISFLLLPPTENNSNNPKRFFTLRNNKTGVPINALHIRRQLQISYQRNQGKEKIKLNITMTFHFLYSIIQFIKLDRAYPFSFTNFETQGTRKSLACFLSQTFSQQPNTDSNRTANYLVVNKTASPRPQIKGQEIEILRSKEVRNFKTLTESIAKKRNDRFEKCIEYKCQTKRPIYVQE